jgi:hypothetical protein
VSQVEIPIPTHLQPQAGSPALAFFISLVSLFVRRTQMISSQQIKKRMVVELFSRKLLDNTMRGYWCESMVAEALGPECKTISAGWHAWDLQIGGDSDTFPDRIRIQIKNSAKLQPWNINNGKISECQFDLKLRKKHFYFDNHNPGIACEDIGFLCDLFILCLHDETNMEIVDHLDPMQWKFFLVPVAGPRVAITEKEIACAVEKVKTTGKPATCTRRPETLERGIRGRPPICPIDIRQLSVGSVRKALALD